MNLYKKNRSIKIFIVSILLIISYNLTGCKKDTNWNTPMIKRNEDYVLIEDMGEKLLSSNQFTISNLKNPCKVELWLEYYEDGIQIEKLYKTEEFNFSKKSIGNVAIGLTEKLIQAEDEEKEYIRFGLSLNDSITFVTLDNFYSKTASSCTARIDETPLRESHNNTEEEIILVTYYAGEEEVGNETDKVFDTEYLKSTYAQVYFLKLKYQRLPIN